MGGTPLRWFITGLVLLFIMTALIWKNPLIAVYDDRLMLMAESFRTDALNTFFYMITEFGSIKVMLPIALIISIWLMLRKRYVEVVFLHILFWGVRWSNLFLKGIFERDRPSFQPLIHVAEYSFPSGHAMNSTAFYGFIFYLFFYHISDRQHYAFGGSLTIILILLIIISRIYLGVHYVTDVVAGFFAGLFFLLVVISVFQRTDRKLNSFTGQSK